MFTKRMEKYWHKLPRELIPCLGNLLGQVGKGSDQPALLEDVLTHGRGLRLDGH